MVAEMTWRLQSFAAAAAVFNFAILIKHFLPSPVAFVGKLPFFPLLSTYILLPLSS